MRQFYCKNHWVKIILRGGRKMNISSVSSGSNSTYSAVDNNDSAIQQLEKQEADISKQIQAENNSKDDTKTKQQKVQLLQSQLTLIEAQISQKKVAGQTQTTNSGQQQQSTPVKTAASKAKNKDENDLSSIADIVKRNSTNKKIDVQV
jgi:hypothetical protein